MSDIFISYKREEQPKARRLATALERQGWSVWWDPKLRGGERFDDIIQQALTEARCVLSLLSQQALQSTYVMNETRYALRRNKLIPVVIEQVELPFDLEGLHTPSLINWEGDGASGDYIGLLGDIAAMLGSPMRQGMVNQNNRDESAIFLSEMVLIPAGRFVMGSDPAKDSEALNFEQPTHRVEINSFHLGKYPVTFAEYASFTAATNSALPDDQGWGRDHRPVINVSWEDAVAYADWLSKQTGKSYRLPTEAEWEYAARAGSTTRYGWGDEIDRDGKAWANCDGCGSQWDGKQTAPVGSFEANAFGLYDMAGNVWEWTQDCWREDYTNAPSDGSAWLEHNEGDCGRRVIRGGGWGNKPRGLRSANRSGFRRDKRYNILGFRLA